MVEIKGLKELVTKLKKFGKEGEQRIHDTIDLTANKISLDASQRAPKNLGYLHQSIKPFEVNRLTYKVIVHAEYGAYIEFGTGGKVSIPSELSSVAAGFRNEKRGNFKKGLEAIKIWCQNKGIPVEAAYPIFLSILREGLRPQPYLYPAFVKGRLEFIEDLKKELEDLTNGI